MTRTLALLAMLALSACAIQDAQYANTLDTWIGATEGQLVATWGTPASSYHSPDGVSSLTFHRAKVLQGVQWYCYTTFTMLDGVVQAWQWRGNACG